MTPKEKAIELVNEFQPISGHIRFSKAYALITVKKIIAEYNRIEHYNFVLEKEYWEEVRKEVEKI